MTLAPHERAAFEYAAKMFAPPEEREPLALAALAKAIDPRTVQTPALDLIDNALEELLGTPDGRLIVTLAPQEGKALALDTPIATPAGWTTMGELAVGAEVFDRYGKTCRVTWVSPIWTDRECYAVRTGDGERIVADAAHEWVARMDRRSSERTVETPELARRRSKNAQITAPAGLDLPDADLPLDPYVLGAWLGDGHSDGANFTCADPEILARIAEAGFPAKPLTGSKYGWTLAGDPSTFVRTGRWGNYRTNRLKQTLRELGVLGNKHIPVEYLRGSEKQRLALLQGLVDTDGYVMPKGQVEFCSTRRVLAEGVRDLVYTLGAKAVMGEGRATINGKDCGPKYRVRFYLANAAHLFRKAKHCKDSSVARVRYTWAEPCESVPTRCIEVDSPTHTFLAGRTLLPTHNSQRCSKVLPVRALQRNPDARIVLASYGDSLARRNGRFVRDVIVSHPEWGLRVRPDVAAQSEWQLDGHDGGVYAAGIGTALTGRACDLAVIDDPIKDSKEADSAVYRQAVWDWWTDVLSTRLAPGAPVLLINTRWHHDDLTGRLLAHEDGHLWRLLNIPAQADHDPNEGETDPLDREPGEYLHSARGRTTAQWDAIKVRVGSRTWNALYQGKPSPTEGDILRRSWWKRYDQPQHIVTSDGAHFVPNVDGLDAEVIQSWDMAFKDGRKNDYVVGQVWLRRGVRAYLLDQVHDRIAFTETSHAVRELSAKWPQAVLKLIEDKANGPAIISQLQGVVGGMVPDEPSGSKEARASAVAPFIEAGNVLIPTPELAPWIGGFIDECASFPNGAHDDQVDAMSAALNRLLLLPLWGHALDEIYEPDEFDEPRISEY